MTLCPFLQRTFRAERASSMARAKAQSGVVGWPGTLTVAEIAGGADGQEGYVLVDGQVHARQDSMPLPFCVFFSWKGN